MAFAQVSGHPNLASRAPNAFMRPCVEKPARADQMNLSETKPCRASQSGGRETAVNWRLNAGVLFLICALFQPRDRTRRCRAFTSPWLCRACVSCGNYCFLRLKAIPYGFRPFLVDRDRKEFIAVIERMRWDRDRARSALPSTIRRTAAGRQVERVDRMRQGMLRVERDRLLQLASPPASSTPRTAARAPG